MKTQPETLGDLFDEYLEYGKALDAVRTTLGDYHEAALPLVHAQDTTAAAIIRQLQRRYRVEVPAAVKHKGVLYVRDYTQRRIAFVPLTVPDADELPLL